MRILFALLIAFFCCGLIQAIPVTDGLVVYLGGEVSSGKAVDSSGNNLNGTFCGDASTGVGKFGDGFVFDGASDYINLGSDSLLDTYGQMTVSMWVKPNSFGAYQSIVNKGDYVGGTGNYTHYNVLFPSGSFRAGHGGTSTNPGGYVDSNTVFSVGVWQHVVITFDPSLNQMKIYYNGNLDASGTITTDPASLIGEELFIGALKNTGGPILNSYNGSLDEIAIYNRILSTNDVTMLFNNTTIPETDSFFLLISGVLCILISRRASR